MNSVLALFKHFIKNSNEIQQVSNPSMYYVGEASESKEMGNPLGKV